jgi:hypothetical protein
MNHCVQQRLRQHNTGDRLAFVIFSIRLRRLTPMKQDAAVNECLDVKRNQISIRSKIAKTRNSLLGSGSSPAVAVGWPEAF